MKPNDARLMAMLIEKGIWHPDTNLADLTKAATIIDELQEQVATWKGNYHTILESWQASQAENERQHNEIKSLNERDARLIKARDDARNEMDALKSWQVVTQTLLSNLMMYRQGELPTAGWLRDNDAVRALLHALSEQLPAVKCKTCNDTGSVQDSEVPYLGNPCPDCSGQPLPGGHAIPQRDKMPGECAPIWPPEPVKLSGGHDE